MKYALSVCLAFFSFTAIASPYYFSNPYSPYPPGCVKTAQMEQALAGENVVKVWSGAILLAQALHTDKLIPANLEVYRAGCAEPDRSLILLEFSIPDRSPQDKRQFVLPEVVALADELLDEMFDYPMTLAAEPNSWGFVGNENREVVRLFGDFTHGADDASQFRWVYVLDVSAPPLHWEDDNDLSVWDPRLAMSAPRYNGHVGLRLHNGTGSTFINIPPTELLFDTASNSELNGRFSGNWVAEGADDQGLMLSFSSKVAQFSPNDTYQPPPLIAFLSWYTFDAQGRLLWLTGSAEFPVGSTEVTIPLVYVSNGQFMSQQPAFRSEAGSVRLVANSCNKLRMDYELNKLALGTGTHTLQRIFALEVAGFPCRDYDARLAEIFSISAVRAQP